MKAQLAAKLISNSQLAGKLLLLQENHSFDYTLYSKVETFIIYCLEKTKNHQFRLKLLYLLVLYYKRNKKTDCLLKYFQIFHQIELPSSLTEKQQAFLLRSLIENTLNNDYNKTGQSLNKKFSKAITFNDLILKTAEQIKTATATISKLWQQIQLDVLDLRSTISLIKKFFLESKRIASFFRELKQYGTPAASIYKLYIEFLRNVAFDFDKANFYFDLMQQSIGRKYLSINEVDLQSSKFTLNTPKTFVVLSGEPGKYGQIKYLSEELKQTLGLDGSLNINKNIGKLKPQPLENFYKHWISKFFEDEQNYSDVTNDTQFYDVFVDKDGFIKLFLINFRLSPSFKSGIEFMVFFTQVKIPHKSRGMMVFSKTDGSVLGFDRYFKEEFQMTPDSILIESSLGFPIFTVWDMFANLKEKIDLKAAKDGVKVITTFSPSRVIRKRKAMNEILQNHEQKGLTESCINESIDFTGMNVSVNQFTADKSKVPCLRKRNTVSKLKDQDFVIELHLVKIFELDGENFAAMTIRNLSVQHSQNGSNNPNHSVMVDQSFLKSHDRVVTYISLSNLANKKYHIDRLKLNWYFEIIQKTLLLLFAVQIIFVGVLLSSAGPYMQESFLGMEMVRFESIKQRYFVESFIEVVNAQNFNSTSISVQLLADMKKTNRANLERVKVNENRFLMIFNSLLYADHSDPKFRVGTPEFISSKAQNEAFFILNMTEPDIRYTLSPTMMSAHLLFLMGDYFNINMTNPYLKISANFPYMLLTLRSLLDGILKATAQSFEGVETLLRTMLYFFVILLVIKKVFVVILIRLFQTKIDQVYRAFSKISKNEAQQYLKLIDLFHQKFNFMGSKSSARSTNVLGSINSTRNAQPITKEMQQTMVQHSMICFDDVSEYNLEDSTPIEKKESVKNIGDTKTSPEKPKAKSKANSIMPGFIFEDE